MAEDPNPWRPPKRSRNDEFGLSMVNEEAIEDMLEGLTKNFRNRGNRPRANRLQVSNTIIGEGSQGSAVFEGFYDDRPVAVKQLLPRFFNIDHDLLEKIRATPLDNIVNFHGEMICEDSVYLALERCTCSLHDFIQACSVIGVLPHDPPSSLAYEEKLRDLRAKMGPNLIDKLWYIDSRPTSLLKRLMRDVLSGLVQLQALEVVHGDLKPQNVLVTSELRAKISDVGISKRIHREKTSNPGTGWQSRDQLQGQEHTMAGDLFSLGCIFYYCVTGGRHPFGGILERDMNIWSNQVNLSFVKELIPEAHDLISHLLNPIPQWRPMASELCSHPFFWKSSKRLNFLCVFSDTLQENLRENSNPDLLMALESNKSSIFEWDWPSRLEFEFRVLISFGGQRSYSPYHARDLLKAIRDKWDKRQELPEPAEGLFRSECPVGAPLDECYDTYFARRFPNLLIEAYQVARYFCRGDPWFEAFKECED